ncbi:hypothetical protein [Micromonospora tulbaghiae]|uniref:hypothetical protein n=1 Tax=Micromonospora tulbaghiae TaxID=479978 RepID=UPI0033D99E94
MTQPMPTHIADVVFDHTAPRMAPAGVPGAPKTIGIDLSLTCTGVAGRGWTDTIRPPAKLRGHERLQWIEDRIGDFAHRCDLIAVEGPAYGTQRAGIQRGHHERAGLWWLTTQRLWVNKIPLAVVDPTSLKRYATGKGNADKAAMMLAVARRFPWFDGGEDEADALWLAAMAADHLGHPMCDMPAAHRKALDAVQWPDLTLAVA